MEKEKILEDFFKNLKISLNNASIYFPEHPLFIKSVEKLKTIMEAFFNFSTSLRIGISPHSLLVEEKHWEKEKLYQELAQFFHCRKIKWIEINKEVTFNELATFLRQVSLPLKDILKEGGFAALLKKLNISHIFIEELDYSQLLKGEGQEYKDIWEYLLGEAVENEEAKEFKEVVDNFEQITKSFKIKDFLENDKLRENMSKLLKSLKNKDKERFGKCGKALVESILKDKDTPQDIDFNRIKSLLGDLSADDLSEVLLNQILTDDKFDSLTFSLFSQLTEDQKHKDVAASLSKKLKEKDNILKVNPRAMEKIKELFSVSGGSFVSGIYREALSSFLEGASLEKGFSFDRDFLNINYRLILLNLLAMESVEKRLNLIIEAILKELEKGINNKDIGFFKNILEVLKTEKNERLMYQSFLKLKRRVSQILENMVVNEEIRPELFFFIDYLDKSAFDSNFYINKIFKENKVNSYILQLFLKFFSKDLEVFYSGLKKRSSDTSFLKKIVDSFKKIDSSLALRVLKHIFSFSNIFIRIEVLKAMKELSSRDDEFLFSILKKDDFFLKKEALNVLLPDEKNRIKAAELLLTIPNPLGIRSRILKENIRIIDEANLKEAKDYLVALTKGKVFWNRGLRLKAKEVMKNFYGK